MTIKEAREKAGLTQKELSERLGIPMRTISNWESGEREPPDYTKALIIKELCPLDFVDEKLRKTSEFNFGVALAFLCAASGTTPDIVSAVKVRKKNPLDYFLKIQLNAIRLNRFDTECLDWVSKYLSEVDTEWGAPDGVNVQRILHAYGMASNFIDEVGLWKDVKRDIFIG